MKSYWDGCPVSAYFVQPLRFIILSTVYGAWQSASQKIPLNLSPFKAKNHKKPWFLHIRINEIISISERPNPFSCEILTSNIFVHLLTTSTSSLKINCRQTPPPPPPLQKRFIQSQSLHICVCMNYENDDICTRVNCMVVPSVDYFLHPV